MVSVVPSSTLAVSPAAAPDGPLWQAARTSAPATAAAARPHRALVRMCEVIDSPIGRPPPAGVEELNRENKETGCRTSLTLRHEQVKCLFPVVDGVTVGRRWRAEVLCQPCPRGNFRKLPET